MKSRVLVFFILLFVHFFTFLSPLLAEFKGEGFTVYLTTKAKNRYGANIMVNAGNMKIADVPALFDEFNVAVDSNGREISVLPSSAETSVDPGNSAEQSPAKPIIGIIVVPKGASPVLRKQLVDQVRSAVSARYPEMLFEVHESFFDLDADSGALEEQLAELHEIQPHLVPGSQEAELADHAEEVLEEGLVENEQLRLSWFGKFRSKIGKSARKVADTKVAKVVGEKFKSAGKAVTNRTGKIVGWLSDTHPYNTVVAARLVALTKFSVAGMVVISKFGLNPSSAAIAAMAGGVGAFFGYNAVKYSEICTSHTLPWFKEWAPVAWYNKTGWFKSASVNFFRSLVISYILRFLAYASNQSVAGSNDDDSLREFVGTPNSLNFFVSGLFLTLPEVGLDGLMDDGMRALELKGYINHQSRSYILWGISFVDTLMHSLFRANAVSGAYSVAVLSWGAKVVVWSAGKYLPAGPPRMVFVSDRISTHARGELHAEEKRAMEAAKAAGVKVKGPGFFVWFARLVGDSVQEMKNWKKGEFTVSDDTMVAQDHGLGESWSLGLSDVDLKKVFSDRNLKRNEFEKLLNLKDTDVKVTNALWQSRNQVLQFEESQSFENNTTPQLRSSNPMFNICAQALAAHGIEKR